MTVYVVTEDRLLIDRQASVRGTPFGTESKYIITDKFIYWLVGSADVTRDAVLDFIEDDSGWIKRSLRGGGVFGYNRKTGKIHSTDNRYPIISVLPNFGGSGGRILNFNYQILGDLDQAMQQTCKLANGCGNGYDIIDLKTGEVTQCL